MGISQTPVVIVAAIGSNGAIGRDNALPWTMPGDLARFRDLTMGTPMIMGRRTYASIGKPLPGRESIVVSRDLGLSLPAGVHRVCDPGAALALAFERAAAMRAPAISLIGGAALFKALMDRTDRLCLTLVDLAPDADTFFPALDPQQWREQRRIVPPRHPRDQASCVFVDVERVWRDGPEV